MARHFRDNARFFCLIDWPGSRINARVTTEIFVLIAPPPFLLVHAFFTFANHTLGSRKQCPHDFAYLWSNLVPYFLQELNNNFARAVTLCFGEVFIIRAKWNFWTRIFRPWDSEMCNNFYRLLLRCRGYFDPAIQNLQASFYFS